MLTMGPSLRNIQNNNQEITYEKDDIRSFKIKGKTGIDIGLKHHKINKNDKQVIVAIIDSGIATDHPDLEGKILRNEADCDENGKDSDQNGFINKEERKELNDARKSQRMQFDKDGDGCINNKVKIM